MPEITYRSPGFFDREVDLSAPTIPGPVGTPAGIIGTSNKGPAFVPVTVGNFDEFKSIFGDLDVKKQGAYAANQWLQHRTALTFTRVLGAGANTTDAHITTAQTTGRVQNAGVKFDGSSVSNGIDNRHVGVAQLLCARHQLSSNEAYGFPMFTDSNCYNGSYANLVRGVVLLASGARMMVLNGDESSIGAFTGIGPDDVATVASGKFKVVISSSLGSTFGNSDGQPGVTIFTASLNPTDTDYWTKVLNTDPEQFTSYQHVVYADYAVDDEIASPTHVGILSGSANTSPASGDATLAYRKAFGAFDARYASPKTTYFISQPFGTNEYDLFYFEALDDGEYANTKYKISIANIKASTDEQNPYGTFTVQVRSFDDTDTNPIVLESFPGCSLNPNASNYVGALVGDRKVYYNFDASLAQERRVVAIGKYANKSKYVRIKMNDLVERGLVPQNSLPFGFRGLHTLKTNDNLNDTAPASTISRLGGVLGVSVGSGLSGSIVPPIPMRFKITRGDVTTSGFEGNPGYAEKTSPFLYWGIKFERNTNVTNPNLTSEKNGLISSLAKFNGIEKLDMLTTGSGADTFNANKFSLAKVAFSNTSITHLTSTLDDHLREAAYIRGANLDLSDYTVNTSIGKRITFATILAKDTATNFNKWTQYTKFTNMLAGGYDGLNFVDKNNKRMNDKSTSFDAGGCAEANYVSPGLLTNVNGTGQSNACVSSYVTAINVMTDPMIVNTNILAIPGIKEPFITDYAASKVRDYGMALYVSDIPSYDHQSARLYDDSTGRPDVEKSVASFEGRGIDNNYCSAYFPDVYVDDEANNRRVKLPASVAALGAIAYNDRIAFPWFAPAGFNRAALDFVKNTTVRLNSVDRDRLYDARINPIATFPKYGFVIYGQKTLQANKSALDRVNVRRLLLEAKRSVVSIAMALCFENNTKSVREKFTADASLQLGLMQAQGGIEQFSVVCNETNNTQNDIDLNKMNGKIVIVPTRTIEYIAIDFIITNSGVTFV